MTNGDTSAGASARREYERRRAKDEARIHEDWGRFGKLAVALTPERQSTAAWNTGAIGEQRVGARLDSIASADIRVLHDRRIPGSRANIDHLAVTRGGVWVIDSKRYKGQRPDLVIEGGILRPRVEKLTVGRRDQTKLVDGVLGQVQHVRAAIDAPVRGVLCFVDADWPMIGGTFRVRGVEVLWPVKLMKLLTASSEETVADVGVVAQALESWFRPA